MAIEFNGTVYQTLPISK